MGLPVKIWPMPVEIPSPIRFDQDTVHHSYDPVYANRCWRILSQVARVLTESQCAFVGKSQPGPLLLGRLRPGGRRAFPAGPRRRARDRRSCARRTRTRSSATGSGRASGPLLEPAFYAYAVPEPAGLKEARVEPARPVLSPRARRVHPAVRRGQNRRVARSGDPVVCREHLRSRGGAWRLGSSRARAPNRVSGVFFQSLLRKKTPAPKSPAGRKPGTGRHCVSGTHPGRSQDLAYLLTACS